MEICKDNIWGAVCHRLWGTADARVVCRQLGYSVAGTAKARLGEEMRGRASV